MQFGRGYRRFASSKVGVESRRIPTKDSGLHLFKKKANKTNKQSLFVYLFVFFYSVGAVQLKLTWRSLVWSVLTEPDSAQSTSRVDRDVCRVRIGSGRHRRLAQGGGSGLRRRAVVDVVVVHEHGV